ncbi:unnamed protein product [Paramecium pentaurelia]|uniref:Transmembrane protein n=1 Tax=Paramecium pentaurelia TaxID=43138 RepID=A0A8S1XIE9_9CILI|nr:unnamed protein product [Paramecium pentaurelia]
MILIILASFTLLSVCKHCSSFPYDYTKIVAKENEKIVQDLGDYFGKTKYKDVVTLRDENHKLSLLNPIQLINTMEMPPNFNKIISYSVLTSSEFEWLNKYQLLAINKDDDIILIWTEHFVAGTQGRLPNFDSNKIIGNINQVKCQSSVILDAKHLLIDCYQIDTGNLNNQFYLINQDQEEIIKIENTYPLLTDQKRYILSTNNYIYRITTYSTDNPSYIEIFTYDLLSNQIQRIKIIDQELILNYVTFREYSFEIVEVKVGPQDQILILDSIGNLFQMKYLIDKDSWEFSFLVMRLGNSISFDYSFKYKRMAVLQPFKIIYGIFLTEYNSIEDLSQSRIHITNNFLYLVSSTKIISFLLDIFQPIYQTTGDFSHLLTDYTQNDFLAFSNTNIKHYLSGSEYKIQYLNNQPELKGTAILNHNQCQVTIEYQTVARDSKELILVSKGNIIETPFLSDTIYLQYTLPNSINKLVDGPTQSLSFQKVDNNNLEQSGNVSYIGVTGDLKTVYENENLSLKNLIFTQTISMLNSNDNNYLIITQNQEKLLKIYRCYIYIAQACTQSYETLLTFKITTENTAIQYEDQALKFITLLDKNNLFYYQFFQGEYFNKTITLTDQDPIDEIDNIYTNYKYFIAYSKTKKIIGVYEFKNVIFLYSITLDQMKKFGISDWNPQRLFCNNYKEILFLINGQQQNEVFILTLNLNYFTLDYVMKINESKDIRIITFVERFAILQQYENGIISFDVFNMKEITNIYFEKTPTFYDYKIQDLNSIYWVSSKNLLHSKAQLENKQYLLTYMIEQTDHNSLYTVQVLNETNQYITVDQDRIFQFNQDVIQIYWIQRKPNLVYYVNFKDETFISNVKYQIIYKNGQELQVNQNFRLVNTYIELKAYPDKINITTNLSTKVQNNNIQNMGRAWYFGEVSKFDLESPDIKGQKIEIIDPIEQLIEYYQNNTISIADLDNNHVFVLKSDSFLIVSKKSNQVVAQKSITQGYDCKNILASFQSKILIMCTQEKKQFINGIQCVEAECKVGDTWLQIDDDIIFGQMDEDNIYIVQKQSILVYSNQILDILHAKNYGLITFEDFEYFQQGLAIKKIQTNLYHIYCTDLNQNFIILEYIIKDEKLVRINKINYSLYDLLNNEFYLLPSAELNLIKVINLQNQGAIFQIDYIIFATVGPHYGIRMEFNCKSDSCTLSSQKIIYILQGYGESKVDSLILPKVIIKQKYVSIVYQFNNPGHKSYTQAIYEIPEKESTNSAVYFYAAIQDVSYAYYLNFQTELYTFANELYLISNLKQYGQLRLYKVNQSPKLLIDGNISEAKVTISLKNDYVIRNLYLDITASDDPGQSDNNGHTILWVILGIVGGLIVLGVGFWCCKKKKSKNEPLL